ncbi:hypothetical protein [Saccharothrix yanglingensis]|uniref:hypothetical protein n=1 Tax=Saccharothrix yanglingensis TaxID=659496 RepID=UPI0027D2175E|nr:hypothetical protein [Saccharothrix yanglingensis]
MFRGKSGAPQVHEGRPRAREVALKGASEVPRRGFDRFRADLDGVARLGPRDE